ncbi:MAG: FAD-binding protein [Sulfolobales archaeon]
MEIRFEEVDVLIVGSGLGGLATAFFINKVSDYTVAVSSKTPAGYGSSTFYSQGAFRCPGASYSEDDFIRDTLVGGRYINRRYLVEIVARECRESIQSLGEAGIVLRETPSGFRVVSSDKLFPGRELSTRLASYLASRGVRFLERATLFDVVRSSNGGYIALHALGDSIVAVGAKVVVLATGGAANAYLRSDNPSQLTCDGHALALRLGLPLVDMEFVQFFPLGVAEYGKPPVMIPFTRGRLVNKYGEDIVRKYGLESLGRAVVVARDALSRYMMVEVKSGNSVNGALLVYPTEGGDELNAAGFETMRRLNLKPPVRVLPTAHYTMGGVRVDSSLRTALPGLYVAGELVGGVHGANRLGGNALTACVALSRRVAQSVVGYLEGGFDKGSRGLIDEREVREALRRFNPSGKDVDPAGLRLETRRIMWENVGVLRSEESLKNSLEKLYLLAEEVSKARVYGVRGLVEVVEAENTILTSLSIAASALERRESRGSHFRVDYPEEIGGWVKSIRVELRGGRVVVSEESP